MAAIRFGRNGAAEIEVIPHTFFGAQCVRLFEGEEKSRFLSYIEFISNIIKDEKEMMNLWYAWCVMNAPEMLQYFNGLKYPDGNQDQLRQFTVMHTIFNCEAHNELMSTFLRMVHEGITDIGYQNIYKIKKLQEGVIYP
jgi:hypothetical protein